MSVIWTIGHSTHARDPFLDLLRSVEVSVVVDVRSTPYSAHVPWASRRPLGAWLTREGLRYAYRGDALGGKPEADRFYDEEGYVRYDRIAGGDRFQAVVEGLVEGARGGLRMALLCAEEDPAGCHRHVLVGRALRGRGVELRHLRGDGRVESDAEVEARTEGQLGLFGEEGGWRSVRPVR